ncbi:hypothetical protein ZIOFF_024797 [Zingiber officinale]|uniref:Uncharacterized protein n=1 Tax=Zingiber officinale TaxID=94328 RepID=A0A8J5GZ02_ZINOF|nr:hypothetical protein ZIOFF_024797 [Zingiber officinale]
MASFSWTEEDVLRCCDSKHFAKERASASPFSDLHHAIQSARRIWFNKDKLLTSLLGKKEAPGRGADGRGPNLGQKRYYLAQGEREASVDAQGPDLE